MNRYMIYFKVHLSMERNPEERTIVEANNPEHARSIFWDLMKDDSKSYDIEILDIEKLNN